MKSESLWSEAQASALPGDSRVQPKLRTAETSGGPFSLIRISVRYLFLVVTSL